MCKNDNKRRAVTNNEKTMGNAIDIYLENWIKNHTKIEEINCNSKQSF